MLLQFDKKTLIYDINVMITYILIVVNSNHVIDIQLYYFMILRMSSRLVTILRQQISAH